MGIFDSDFGEGVLILPSELKLEMRLAEKVRDAQDARASKAQADTMFGAPDAPSVEVRPGADARPPGAPDSFTLGSGAPASPSGGLEETQSAVPTTRLETGVSAVSEPTVGAVQPATFEITGTQPAEAGTAPEPKDEPNSSNVKTVWVYLNRAAPIGDEDHVRIFADVDAARRWLDEHDPEGVAFQYPVLS